MALCTLLAFCNIAGAEEGTLFTGAGVTASKPQSKLWYHDGTWWAVLLDGTGNFIHRLDGDRFEPIAFVDGRKSARADVLWNGKHLFVLMCHRGQSRLYKFRYDEKRRWYRQLPGFPVRVALGAGWENATIAQDTTGALCIAYVAIGGVNVLWSSATSHRTWNPYGLPIAHGVKTGDLAAIVAFQGRLGVLWCDKAHDRFAFRSHIDGTPEVAWQPVETVCQRKGLVDNHVNLAVTPDERVLAVTKDCHNVVHLHAREKRGRWQPPVRVASFATRPIVVCDAARAEAYVFFTDRSTEPHAISYKKAPLGRLATLDAAETTVFLQAGLSPLNDVTSTKQRVGEASGLLVAARAEDRYVHFRRLVHEPITHASTAGGR